jgi:ferredoxin
MRATVASRARASLDLTSLGGLCESLKARGYQLIGPRFAGTAITYQPIDSVDDLPRGWESAQSAGRYRLQRRDDEARFAYGPAAESLKRYLLPPKEVLWRARRRQGRLTFEPDEVDAPMLAIIGVRACELEAIARLDKVFLQGAYVDAAYKARRANLLLVAANCVDPGDTCFCASMKTGPRAAAHFDLALTEIGDGQFLVEVGSALGASILDDVNCRDASRAEIAGADAAMHAAAARMGRELDVDALSLDLAEALEHPAWDDVAKRCLACANCTLLCPTCFCHNVEDRTSLEGDQVERRRTWDSCFTGEFSYIHGGSIRTSVRARYRQWLLHKFSAWVEQFGTYGCVGCGRCITWCPAGIDVIEEITRLRERP